MAKSETILSILLILVMLSVASLGTFAYLNDTETSGGYLFSAGTLDLQVSGAGWLPVSFTNMKPGDGMGGAEHTTITYQFVVKNVGSLNGILSMKIINVKNYENGRNAPEIVAGDNTGGNPGLGNGELGQFLNLQINMPGPAGFYYGLSCSHGGCLGGRKHAINCWENHVITVGTLPAGTQWAPCVLEFELPSNVGNIIQSDSVVFDIEVRLDQA